MARPKADVVLADEERDELMALASRPRTAQAIAKRATIILACAGGHDNVDVARIALT